MFDWLLSIIQSPNYSSIFLLMVLENLFPIHPIPSELILLLAGFAVAKGDLHVVAVVLVATCGAVLGSIPWYILGRLFSIERLKQLSARYGRLLTLSPHDIALAEAWFLQHGQKAILFGRMLPAVRTLISVPAGMARMQFRIFLLYSFVGSALWTTFLVVVGYVLQSQYAIVSDYITLVSKGLILLIIGVYVYRVITFRAKDIAGQQEILL